ncbi:TMEM33/Pom33 family [Dillenia turbinata]|uniref:TMEM33/Pom33 family n=1 Tax=Dillenia turbinata TaxID=194707 RepID=A0AAN8VII0_9MAGN
MGGEEDPQKIKRIAAAAYDYENDPRWNDYWSNILIPPHMAARSDVVDYFKRKFYQRFIDPDLVVEAMSTASSSQPTSSSSPSSTSSGTTNNQSRSRSSGSTARTSGTPSTTAQNPTSLRWDRQTIQFSINAWVLIVAVLAIFPLLPKHLSHRGYRLSFMGTACSSLFSLYTLYGVTLLCPICHVSKPRAWNLQAVQTWFQSVIVTKDFIYFIYCLTFVTSHLYLRFALIPILCRALEHVAKFLRRNFSHSSLYRKYLEEPCVWVESNTTTLSILSSHAEIALGFLLIISLLSSDSKTLPFSPVATQHITDIHVLAGICSSVAEPVVEAVPLDSSVGKLWKILKLMYHAPATAGYHQSVWAKIGRTVNPLVYQYAPFLNTPISAAQRWWFR